MQSVTSFAVTLALLTSVMPAQAPTILKDINTKLLPTPSYPNAIVSQLWIEAQTFSFLGRRILFGALTDDHGRELWISDGTKAGTTLVKDINPGSNPSWPLRLRVTNDGKRAFFMADDGKSGRELWVTDGTTTGTVMVADLNRGSRSSSPEELVAFGKSSVIFIADDGQVGREVYISDGTVSGTKRLADIRAGSKTSYPWNLRATRDATKVFFTANDGLIGYELYVTDGTAKGTRLVKDLYPGRRSGGIFSPVPLGESQVLFRAFDGKTGGELWISDGTSVGTKMVLDLNPGMGNSVATGQAMVMGNKVIFNGYTPGMGWEPYVTDGTAKGTLRLIDAYPGTGSGWMQNAHLDSSQSKVYWSSRVGLADYRIFVSDGTPLGTKMFTPKRMGHLPVNLVESQGKVYFEGFNVTPGTGAELCVSDGTVAGTKTLRDTNPGSASGYARYLTRYDRTTVLYVADDDAAGYELWKMTGGKVFQLIDINRPKVLPTRSANPETVARFGKYVVFSASDGKSGKETWISDGTSLGTSLLKDINPGIKGSFTSFYAVAGNKLVFDASTPSTGRELFVTDGTSGGTMLLKDIRPGMNSSFPRALTSVGTRVFFRCNDGSTGYELWVTDGTAKGTYLVKDLVPGSGSSTPTDFAGEGDRAVFGARSERGGYELYITDGTSSGTRLLKEINPGIASSFPTYMTYCGGKVYFKARSDKFGDELFVTDFTTAGTKIVRDLYLGRGGSYPAELCARNGRIFFAASGRVGRELYVSDGTATGTKLFLDYTPGQYSTNPAYISVIGSRNVYFYTNQAATGKESVITDGTKAGTKVLDINPGKGHGYGYFPSWAPHRVALGRSVFLRGYTPVYGDEVYIFDNGPTAEPLGSPYGSTWIHGSDPVLGGRVTIEGGTSLRYAIQLTFMGALATRPVRFGKHGFLHFDLNRFFFIKSVTIGERFEHAFPIPNSPSLKGIQLVVQTASFNANNLAGTLELSNGLHWALGNLSQR